MILPQLPPRKWTCSCNTLRLHGQASCLPTCSETSSLVSSLVLHMSFGRGVHEIVRVDASIEGILDPKPSSKKIAANHFPLVHFSGRCVHLELKYHAWLSLVGVGQKTNPEAKRHHHLLSYKGCQRSTVPARLLN